MTEFATVGANAVEVAVRAMPKGVADRIDGVFVDAAGQSWLQVRVTAAPEDGRANEAVRRVLARLHSPASAVELLRGATSRWKRFRVAGDPAALMTGLGALVRPD